MRLSNISEIDVSLIHKNQSLKIIDLRNNKIECLPEELCTLANLSKLCLDENLLSGLPHSMSKLKNLQILSASNNRLKEIPKGLYEIGVNLS